MEITNKKFRQPKSEEHLDQKSYNQSFKDQLLVDPKYYLLTFKAVRVVKQNDQKVVQEFLTEEALNQIN